MNFNFKSWYHENRMIFLGTVIVIPLVVGLFLSKSYFMMVLYLLALLALLKLISDNYYLTMEGAEHLRYLLPDYIEHSSGDKYYLSLIHERNTWYVTYKNKEFETLPGLEGMYSHESLSKLVDEVNYQLRCKKYIK